VHRFTQQLVATGLYLAIACSPAVAFALTDDGLDAVDQPVSAAEEDEAIRWVMVQGAQSMIDRLGQENGLYSDPRYRIPMPEQYRKMEKVLRRVGGAKYADAFLLALNRTAEQAIAEGGPLIIDTINTMPIEDRQSLINGSSGSIGNYFNSKAATILLSQFSPLIAKHADKVGLLDTMDEMLEKARFVKAIHEAKTKLDRMILEHVVLLITAAIKLEEDRIKTNPWSITNPLLQKVFGKIT
jgi:hypothetical protein